MAAAFTPTAGDVARYQTLRVLSRQLNTVMAKEIPAQAFREIAGALGLLRNGVVAIETEDMGSVLADSCLYEWIQDGRSLVERFAESHPAMPGTDERFLLDAYLQAEFGIILPQSAVAGAGIHCKEFLSQQNIFVMDSVMSRNFTQLPIATRLIPLGEYWMTGGAGLPIVDAKVLDAMEEMFVGKKDPPLGRSALMIVRACLDAGAAERIRYSDTGDAPRKRPIKRPTEPRHIWKRRK